MRVVVRPIEHRVVVRGGLRGEHPENLLASDIGFVPAGSLASTNVQDAIVEAAQEAAAGNHNHDAVYEPLGSTAAHSALTQNIHGITDTADLIQRAEPLTAGSILFASGANTAQQDNANLFWDDTTKQLRLAAQGASAGLLMGGDALLYRDSVFGFRSNANLKVIGSGAGRFVVGAVSFLSGVTSSFVSSGASNMAVGVQGAASQSVNLTEWRDSAGAALTQIGPAGRLIFPNGQTIDRGIEWWSGATGNFMRLHLENNGLTLTHGGALANFRLKSALVLGKNQRVSFGGAGDLDTAEISHAHTDNNNGELIFRTKNAGVMAERVRVLRTLDGLSFGAAGDTNLYRSAADVLRTDDGLHIAQKLRVEGSTAPTSGVGIEIGYDTGTGYIYPFDRSAGSYKPLVLAGAPSIGFNTGSGGSTGRSVTVTSDRRLAVRTTASADGKLHVEPQVATEIGLIVQGAASQSSNLIEVRDSAGAVRARVSPLGAIISDQAAATNLAFGAIVPGDNFARWQTDAKGLLEWGPGNTARDTNLYRAAADILKTDDAFQIENVLRAIPTSAALRFGANKRIEWSNTDNNPGATADTNLYRLGADSLATDDLFTIFRAVITDPSFSTRLPADSLGRLVVFADGKMEWGDGTNARDANLYRRAAAELKTDHNLIVAQKLAVGTSSAVSPQLYVQPITAGTTGAVIQARPSQTANLQEWQSSTGAALSWVDNIGSFLAPNGTTSRPGHAFRDNAETGMYRPVQNVLGLVAGAAEVLRVNSSALFTLPAGASFLIGADTNLYRQAADYLATDDDFGIRTIGKGLRIAEGANAKMGIVPLVAGEAVVATTAVTANSRVFLTPQPGGTAVSGSIRVSAIVPGVSFTITSANVSDDRPVAWMIVEPA